MRAEEVASNYDQENLMETSDSGYSYESEIPSSSNITTILYIIV